MKHALPEVNQTTLVKTWYISESVRLISDIIEMCVVLDIPVALLQWILKKCLIL